MSDTNSNRSKTPSYTYTQKYNSASGSSPARTTGKQSSISPTTPKSSPEAKQHDRTTSLMALQALAEKIAIYKEKYGRIETRHSSSIKASPKQYKRQQQREK